MDKKNSDSTNIEKFEDDTPIDTLKNLNPNEKLNENIVKYKVPIGRSGPVIGLFPIILSDFEIDINCELKYKHPITNIKSLKNNVEIKKFIFLNDNYKLLIEGYVSKYVEILTENDKSKKTNVNIPFKTVVDIKYSTFPKFSFDEEPNYKKGYKIRPIFDNIDSLKIYWRIENINLFEKITTAKDSDEIIYKIIVSLNVILLQNQKVFIPEPSAQYEEGNFPYNNQ